MPEITHAEHANWPINEKIAQSTKKTHDLVIKMCKLVQFEILHS